MGASTNLGGDLTEDYKRREKKPPSWECRLSLMKQSMGVRREGRTFSRLKKKASRTTESAAARPCLFLRRVNCPHGQQREKNERRDFRGGEKNFKWAKKGARLSN